MLSLFPDLFVFEQFAPLILRLVLGAIFIIHGYQNFFTQFEETVAFLESINLRPSRAIAILTSWVSLLTGIFLVAGFLTQLAAVAALVMSLGLIWKVNFRKGFVGAAPAGGQGWEFDLALLAMALSLIFLGPGKFSIDLPF